MNVLKHEFRSSIRSTLSWSLSLVIMLIVFMYLFPAVRSQATDFQKLISLFPKELTRLLGLDSIDLITTMGFYGFVFTYIVLVGSIQSISLGLTTLAHDLNYFYADFLLSKPIGRSSVAFYKILASLISLMITNFIFIICAKVICDLYRFDGYSVLTFALITLTLPLIQLLFFSFGLMISMMIRNIKTVTPLSLGIVFFFYILSMIGDTVQMKEMTILFPFSYYDPTSIIQYGNYQGPYLWINLVSLILFLTISVIIYLKKDIRCS